MPKIYEYLGLVLLIYTNEHEPIHVHAKSGSNESVIEIMRNPQGKVVYVRKRKTARSNSTVKELSAKDLQTALKFVNIKAEEIVLIWHQIREGNYKRSPIIITRKIV